MNNNWIGIRLFYGDNAFGLSGDLSSDLKKLCIKHHVELIRFEGKDGYSKNEHKGNNSLFGGTSKGLFNVAELFMFQSTKEAFLEELKAIAKEGKDAIAFYEFALHTFNYSE